MIKNIFIVVFCLVSSAVYADADDPSDFELMARAVIFATQADAYNAHCGKESALAADFLDIFNEKEGVSEEERTALNTLHQTNKDDTIRNLEAEQKSCKDVQFMLKRLTIMRELKDASYRLNGVDPETLPQDFIPELEGLLPPRPALPESKNPLEL